MKFDEKLVNAYIGKFANRSDVYAMQVTNNQRYWYEPRHEPVTLDLVQAHLNGEITIGWYNLSEDSESKWLCFDSDAENGRLFDLAKSFKDNNWQVVLEGQRNGRDGHLWLFFDQAVPAVHLRHLGKVFLDSVEIPEKELEMFPKQDSLKSLGNLVRGPLGVHQKPGAGGIRGWFDGPEKSIQKQLEWLVLQPINSSTRLLSLAEQLQEREQIKASLKNHHSMKSKGVKTNHIDWKDYARRNGFNCDSQFWRGPCPSCKAEGHDAEDNHLWISESGAVGCWRGCTFNDLLAAAR